MTERNDTHRITQSQQINVRANIHSPQLASRKYAVQVYQATVLSWYHKVLDCTYSHEILMASSERRECPF